MKKDILTTLQTLRKVSLTAQEKNAMRSGLIERINAGTPIPSPLPEASWYSLFWSHQFTVGYAVLFITLSLSTTMVFAAEQALPGDLLYTVKTKVNEKVERAFVPSSPIRLAQFETKLVERRLQEAEKLDEDFEFKDDVKKIVRDEIEKQADKAEKAVAKVRIAREASVPEAAPQTMMMQTNVAEESQLEDGDDSKESGRTKMRAKSNDDNDDEDDDKRESLRKGKSFEHGKDDDLDLDRVYEKHKEIIKKLDIKKNNRSHGNDELRAVTNQNPVRLE